MRELLFKRIGTAKSVPTRGFIFLVTLLIGLMKLPTEAAESTNAPKSVKVGTYVLFLGDFDVINKTFSAELWLWSNGSRKEESPLKSIEFINSKSVTLSLPQMEESDSGTYFATKANGIFRYKWDTHNFPFDRHSLKIAFESPKDDRDALIFEPDAQKSSLHPEIHLDGWRIERFGITESPAEYHTDFGDPKTASPQAQFSRVAVSVDIRRSSYFSFFKVTSGVYFSILVVLLSFFLPTSQMSLVSPRLSMLGATLFAILVNLRSAESVLGRTEALTLVDKIHIVAMIYVAVAVIITIVSRRKCDLEQMDAARRLDRLGFWRFLATYFVINAGLILQAYYQG